MQVGIEVPLMLDHYVSTYLSLIYFMPSHTTVSVRFMSEGIEVSESEQELLVDVYRSGRMEEPLVFMVKDVPGTASRGEFNPV